MEEYEEICLGDIYEEIQEQLTMARTRSLMGEPEIGSQAFQRALLEFLRFRGVLECYPGYYALFHAFEITLRDLCQRKTGFRV